MSSAGIAAIRRFNRFYTKQIGVLDEGILRSPYSLVEVRVLYEIANGGDVSAVDLARELSLDRGYLSRIVRRFRKAGLLRQETSTADRRRSLLTLTDKGRSTFAALNSRQDGDVATLLEHVPAAKRRALAGAMRTIEEALGAPSPESAEAFVIRQPRTGEISYVVHRQAAMYAEEYGYDERFEAIVLKVAGEFIERFDPARERCWIAERDGEIAGSIFLVKKSATVAKLRLLYVEPSARGFGIGAKLVDECVRFARDAGYRKITLWTQSELRAARHLYEKAGFTLAGKQKHRDFARRQLVAETWELEL